jgi:hypothetical protein
MSGLVAAGSGTISGCGHLAVGLIHRIRVLYGFQALTAITMVTVFMFGAIGDTEFSSSHFTTIAICINTNHIATSDLATLQLLHSTKHNRINNMKRN